MADEFTATTPAQGDTDWFLLAKATASSYQLCVSVGLTDALPPMNGDTENTLLRKLATNLEQLATAGIGGGGAGAITFVEDEAERLATAPSGIGQILYQNDTQSYFTATGVADGDWNAQFFFGGDGIPAKIGLFDETTGFFALLQCATPLTGSRVLSLPDYDGTLATVNLPQNPQTGAYTLVALDVGKVVPNTTGGWTVNNSVHAAGDVILLYNNSGSSQNITAGTITTMRLGGTTTTGTRALAARGIATLYFQSASEVIVSGSGVT